MMNSTCMLQVEFDLYEVEFDHTRSSSTLSCVLVCSFGRFVFVFARNCVKLLGMVKIESGQPSEVEFDLMWSSSTR
jgi:hypothetical protein